MATKMTREEIRAFLSAGTKTGSLATVRADGRPHVAPVWFVLDDADNPFGFDIVLNTGATSVKGRTLVRDGRVAMSVDDATPPYAFVMVDGVAETSDDLDAMLPFSIRIGARYMGPERGEQFGRRNAVEGELLIRIRPTNVVAIKDMAD